MEVAFLSGLGPPFVMGYAGGRSRGTAYSNRWPGWRRYCYARRRKSFGKWVEAQRIIRQLGRECRERGPKNGMFAKC